MVIIALSVHDRAKKVCFFEETFLLADININVALRMLFLILSNPDIRFTDREPHWRFYTVPKALLTTRCIKFINQKKFTTTALGKNNEVYVVHMASLTVGTKMTIYPSWTAQIALLIADEAPVTVLAEYSNFADMFSPESTAELPKYTEINDHPIELIND